MAEEFDPKEVANKLQGVPLLDRKALHFGKEEIFKFVYPDSTELIKAIPTVLVRNQSNTWIARVPLSVSLQVLFHGSPHFYVRAVPRASGELYFMEFVGNQGW